MADKRIFWSKTGLTGGEATKLDSIDGADLQDGEVAHVWMSNVLYIYLLDVDSGAAESSPAIIAPATNAGDKRWILQSYYSGSGTLYTDHIAESTAGHGVEIDGVTLKDGGSLAVTGGANTFNLANGTASLDVAAGSALNVDADLTVSGVATIGGTASRIVGQKATGDTGMLTGAEVRTILGTAPLVLGSDADGDMYYRASSLLARLAKGDAKALLGMDDSQVPAYRKLMVSDAGIMTNAYQPAFLVTPASAQTDIAINANVEVVWGTEVFDTGGNFASNTFTAPVTGVYHFDVLLDLENFDSAMGVLFVYINITGRPFRFKMSGNHVAADTDFTSVAFGVTVKLSATNVAKVAVYQSGGSAQLDITTNSYFSGFLIG